jgi:hypothetical protein
MAEESLAHVAVSAAAGLISWGTTMLTTIRSHGKRLGSAEEDLEQQKKSIEQIRSSAGRAMDVEQSLPQMIRNGLAALEADLDGRIRRVSKKALEDELDDRVRRAGRASRPDFGQTPPPRNGGLSSAKVEEIVRNIIRHEFDVRFEAMTRDLQNARTEAREALEIAQQAASEDSLSDFKKSEADRWTAMNRSLGHIEGTLESIRTGMGFRGR